MSFTVVVRHRSTSYEGLFEKTSKLRGNELMIFCRGIQLSTLADMTHDVMKISSSLVNRGFFQGGDVIGSAHPALSFNFESISPCRT